MIPWNSQNFLAHHNNRLNYFPVPFLNTHFNSNSFARGLLEATFGQNKAVTIPERSDSAIGGFPGWSNGITLYNRGAFRGAVNIIVNLLRLRV